MSLHIMILLLVTQQYSRVLDTSLLESDCLLLLTIDNRHSLLLTLLPAARIDAVRYGTNTADLALPDATAT